MPKRILTPEQKAKSVAATRRWRQANKERVREYNRNARAKDPEATREYTRNQTRRWYLKNKYGIEPEEYNALLTSQGNRCAICRTEDPGKRDWRIDHCHSSNKVRGILCHNCNVSLGLMKDNPESIKRMLSYVERFNNERPN